LRNRLAVSIGNQNIFPDAHRQTNQRAKGNQCLDAT
jgi:hypothetical protein